MLGFNQAFSYIWRMKNRLNYSYMLEKITNLEAISLYLDNSRPWSSFFMWEEPSVIQCTTTYHARKNGAILTEQQTPLAAHPKTTFHFNSRNWFYLGTSQQYAQGRWSQGKNHESSNHMVITIFFFFFFCR